LAQIGIPQLVLDDLVVPFTEEEVWNVIKEIPNDRAPGPDGFTGRFYKAAWAIIKEDVVAVFNSFWALDRRNFQLLNTANMVLLRKTAAPSRLKDYRPISLMHSVGKLVTKVLATRLAPHLSSLVNNNQSAFIRGRSIHDNFMAVQLACRWLHCRNLPAVLLKVDIAKAFDSVAWEFLIHLLCHCGFPARWTEWISILLSTASTRVLMNGRPGRKIWHARGLRQGDPLSPMLFVVAMEVLNRMISAADAHGMLNPLPSRLIRNRASLYADDLVVFLLPVETDLRCMRTILDLFADASGLVTNME
jgi:hypothetical protein